MASLRSATIRLAHEKPELREHLLPLLAKAAAEAEEAILDRQSARTVDKLVKILLGPEWTASIWKSRRGVTRASSAGGLGVEGYYGKTWSEAIRQAAKAIGLTPQQAQERREKALGRVAAGPEEDKRIVREALSILPKRSSYSSFKVEDGQAQYWFDLTFPYTDWAYKKKVSHLDQRVHEAYFSALLKKVKPKLAVYGAVPVVRDLSVVIVVE